MSVQIPNTPLYVDYNPYGDGLVLVVPRGIPCENHNQVYSYHSSNTPSLEDVKIYLNGENAYCAIYNEFVNMMTVFGYSSNVQDVTNNIANVFFSWMIKDICTKTEKNLKLLINKCKELAIE